MDSGERGGVVVNTTRITVRPENRKEFFQTISSLLNPIRGERGCLAYRFYEEAGDENSFVLIGEWETRNDCDQHLESEDFAILLASMMILSGRSNIDFKLLSPLADIETAIGRRAWHH